MNEDPRPKTGHRDDERGIALIIALLAMVLLSALGMSLALTTSTETRITATYANGVETFYAVDAAFERAVYDLSLVADWDQALAGTLTSTFVDGPAGPRALANGSRLDLVEATARVTCGKPTCSVADMDATTEERPWGPNNPRWQLCARRTCEPGSVECRLEHLRDRLGRG
jgi:Tfp pilus assembly protein PilX